MATTVPIESVAPEGYKPRKSVPIESVMPDGYKPIVPPTTVDLSGVKLYRPDDVYDRDPNSGAPGLRERRGMPALRPLPSYAASDYEERMAGTPKGVDARVLGTAVPFIGGIEGGLQAQRLQDATLRAKDGKATPDDMQVLKAAQLDAARGMTTPAQIGAGVAGSVRLGGQAAIGSIAGPAGALAGMAGDPGTIMSRYAAQQTPETAIETVDGKPTGNIILGAPPSDSQKEAIAKVAMLQASDSIIEMFGGKTTSAVMGAVGGAAVKQLAKRMPATSEALKAFAKRYGDNTAAQMLDRAQIQGIAPEYLEEVMQSAAAAGIGEPGADPTALLDPTDPEAFNTMMVIGVLNSPRLLGMFQQRQQEKNATPATTTPDLAIPPDEQDFTDEELMALFAGEQAQPAAPQQTPFAPVEGQRLPADTLTMPNEPGTPFPGVPAQPIQATAAPAQPAVEPAPMQRPTSIGATPRFTAQQVEGVPQVESVPFGTQEDRRMSPLEALGRLAGVDMTTPAQASDQLVSDTIEAMSTPRPQQVKPVPVRAVEALYEMAGDKGELTISAMDESITDFVDAFEPSERREALNVWSKMRAEIDAMPEEDVDAWASQLVGRQSEQPAAPEPAPTAPVEALPEALPTPTPVQPEIVAPQADTGPLKAVHYSHEPMNLKKGIDVGKIKGAYSAFEDPTFGKGFYAMEPSDEAMWKGMDRLDLGPNRNDVDITPENPLVISPETVRERGFDALNEAIQSGQHDAIVSRGWGDADMRTAVFKRVRELWKPKFPKGKTDGRFINGAEYDAAYKKSVQEVTGIKFEDFEKLTKADWDQNQIFIPTDKAPDIVSRTSSTPRAAQEPISATVEPVAEKRPRGVGMRRTTPEGSAMVEAAKQQLRDVINNPDIVGRQRSDMLENGKRLIQFLEAKAANPEKMDTGYERGDKVAYTGEQVEPGFRSFIYLEGASAGKEGIAITPEQSAENIAKSQAEYREQQEGFARVAKAQRVEEAKPKRTPPPAKGSTSSTGWSTVAKGVARKDIMGRNVEIVRQADGSWSVTRDEQEMDSGYKSRAEAEKYADGELAQNIRDQVNADSLDSEITEPQQLTQEIATTPKESARNRKGIAKEQIPPKADTGIFRDLTAAARAGQRFVEDLHVRIAPTLARIHAAAKSPVEFVRAAVAKIGEHVRPYARRFLADVRKVNAEFAANPTRGSAPKDAKKLGKREMEAEYRAGVRDEKKVTKAEKALSSKEATAEGKEAAKAAGEEAFAEGRKSGIHIGGMRTMKEMREFLDVAKQALPADQYAARLKVINRLMSQGVPKTDKGRERLNRFFDSTRRQVFKAQTIKGVIKQSKKLRASMPKMEAGLKATVKDILDTFSETKPTDATINKAEALIVAVADGKKVASPKALERAEKAIDAFLNDKSLASMSHDNLHRLKAVLENLNGLHEGNLESLREAQKEREQKYADSAKEVKDNTEKPFEGDEQNRRGIMQFLFNEAGMNIFNKIMALAPEGSILHDLAIKTPDAGENRESKHRIAARDHMMDGLSKLKGSDGKALVSRNPGDDSFTLHPEFTRMSFMLSDYANKTLIGKAIARAVKRDPILVRTRLADGSSIYLTGAERARLYQLGLDPNARYQMTREGAEGVYLTRKATNKIQKLTPADLAEIESQLTKNEKAIGRLIFEFDNTVAKEAVNEMSRKEFGRDLFAEDDKASYRRYRHDQKASQMDAHVGKTFIENQGMLKDIKGGTSPIILGDAFSEYFSHQARVAAIVGRMVPSMRLRELAGTEEFREAVRKTSKNGENVLRDIERTFQAYGEISGEPDSAMWMVNGILSRLASSWLGLNPKTIITTPMSIWSAQSRIPVKHILKNMSLRTRDAKVLSEMRKYAPKMYEMTTSSGFNIVSPETTGESAQKFFGKGARGHEKGQFFLHEANNIPALMTWNAAKSWGEEQGLKGEELMAFTAETAQDAYSVAQPDNRWIYTSGAKLAARKSAAWRVWTFLQGQTSKQYNQAVEGMIRYSYSNKTKADKARMLKDVAVPTFGQALLYTAVGYALKAGYDELDELRGVERRKRLTESIDGFLFDFTTTALEGNIPVAGGFVGDGLRVAKAAAKGEPPNRATRDSGSVLGRPAILIYSMLDASVGAMADPTDKSVAKARKSIVEAASLFGFDTSLINEALDLIE